MGGCEAHGHGRSRQREHQPRPREHLLVVRRTEETSESAIVALAPISGAYWHCKNLTRIHIPDNRHAIFLQVPLHQGDIDYRFALAAMMDAGFDGTFALEGVRVGDPYDADGGSLAYIRKVAEELSS